MHENNVTPIDKAEEPVLTERQKALAAYNNPAFSDASFTLGDRKFNILYLQYDDYNEFVMLLAPLMTTVAAAFMGGSSISLPGLGQVTSAPNEILMNLLRFSSRELPSLVKLICNTEAKRMNAPELLVDEKWIKDNATSPLQLASIVGMQIVQNKFISEIGSFFAQCLPLYEKAKVLSPK